MQEGLHQKEEQVRQEEENKSQESQRRPEGKAMTRTSNDAVTRAATLREHAARQLLLGLLLLACPAISLLMPSLAAAETPGPGWEATSHVFPTHIKPGGKGLVIVLVYDIGAGSSNGTVTMTDVLPPGLEATGKSETMMSLGYFSKAKIEYSEEQDDKQEAEEAEGKVYERDDEFHIWNCAGTTVVTCRTAPGAHGVQRPIKPGYIGRIGIVVKAVGPPGTGENHVTVSGGGAAAAAETSDPFTVSQTPPGFGLDGSLDGWFSKADGGIDTQAGSHPFALTVSFGMNVEANGEPSEASLRNVKVALPPGIIGDPHAVPQCTRHQFEGVPDSACPPDTAVGADLAGIQPMGEDEEQPGEWEVTVPVYNLVPPPGVPAEFGFTIFGTNVLLQAGVRSGSDYGITAAAANVGLNPITNTFTLWGVPGESVHNPERCGIGALSKADLCGYKATEFPPRPLLTVPTSCVGPLTSTLTVESYNASVPFSSESFLTHDTTGTLVGFKGCGSLQMPTTISAAPDTSYADTPAGLTVDVKVPQEGLEYNEGLSTANIKDTTVTLPEGVAINPGQAAGLVFCGPAEDGLTTADEQSAGEEDNGPPNCPNASQVGTDEIHTPLLNNPLTGHVYVLNSNPPHLKLLVAAEGEGVFLKLVGDVELNEKTGQLVTMFKETPELPFTDFKLSFNGGAQAALTTPLRCGTYTTTSDFTPWSSPETADVFPESIFAIDSGPGGSACPTSTLPFEPELTAGSTTDQAGGFAGFSLLLKRGDGQQRIEKLQFKAPQGLSGMLASVPLCEEPQAAAGTCSTASQIGHSIVSSGPGPYPMVIPQPGQPESPLYLTGPYDGAPFGLTSVTHVLAGPFNLGTIITRAKIEIDPVTAQITITTEPLPQVIDGVPTDLRLVDAVIDRGGFMFNPTSCEQSSFSGTAFGAVPAGAGGASSTAAISSRFQVGSCRELSFHPDFQVSTQGNGTANGNGASLNIKLSTKQGPGVPAGDEEANIAKVEVSLPEALPSRLKTLQKACPEATYDANPATCPPASFVGSVVAHTPVLPVPLVGPAVFVSHGGEAFPDLVFLLQG
ncbi:MAG TPA: hypothetical protein VK655_02590, partial [Solirubrobacteraceae bacterium]|nr:hypothetical protein [Solirubrobacteraceae bacterium]